MLVTYGPSNISYTVLSMHATLQSFQNAQAYLATAISYECKMFITLAPAGRPVLLFHLVLVAGGAEHVPALADHRAEDVQLAFARPAVEAILQLEKSASFKVLD